MVLPAIHSRSLAFVNAGLVLAFITVSAHIAAASQGERGACHADGSLVKLAEIREASGIAVSRSVPERLWSHNDSGEPTVFAVDDRGTVTGRLRISGATVEDWEAIAVARCDSGSCLYIADIGDNEENRQHVTIYRVHEPKDHDATVKAEAVVQAQYPDGPQDAETLLATPDGRLYIVTKGSRGPVKLYRVPRDVRPGVAVQLEPVGQPRPGGRPTRDEQITDGAVSPDGQRVVLRTHHALHFFPATDLLEGNWQEDQVVELKDLQEPQGEGVAFASDSLLYLVGESGGGESRPGTLARVSCGK